MQRKRRSGATCGELSSLRRVFGMAALLSSWPLAIATFFLIALMIGTAFDAIADSKSLLVIDFTDESWRPFNDGVMGGLSEGRITWDKGMHWVGQTR